MILYPKALLKANVLIWILLTCTVSHAEEIETFAVDLSDRHISITAGFNGTDMLIFGAISDGDVILTIEGEPESYRVRKKSPIAGIWLNNERRDLVDLPSFYVVASSSNVMENISLGMRAKYRIGYDNIAESISIFDAHAREFYQSFIALKEKAGLYQDLPQKIKVGNSGLFRLNVRFPAAVKPGNYTIRAMSVKDGNIINSYITGLTVNKVGFGAEIYNAAHDFPKLYGIGAIIISVLSGLLANFIFSRRKG